MRRDGGMLCLHSPLKGFGGFSASFKPGSWLKSWFLQGLACMESLNPSERRRRLSALRELGISSGNEAQAEAAWGGERGRLRCGIRTQRIPLGGVSSGCSPIAAIRMRAVGLFLLCLPAALLAQGQYSRFEGITYPEPVQYSQYDQQSEIQDYYDYHDVTPRAPEEQFRYQSQQQSQQEIVPAPTPAVAPETEPTEPGPLDCREEQYPCTRLYSVHKPCKQCLNEICFYSLRRVYVINKEICVRTVCAHEELLRADLCRDKFSKCGVMATSGLCQTLGASCARSCGGC
ncbi:microfibrillar-associated protein 2 isoform X1 [Columba livia]|uniref:microfibrillar-associated protein 2 isoform X1 n=2 Tax=Columba livia TaxID=8932 RepID=UPI0031BAAC35